MVDKVDSVAGIGSGGFFPADSLGIGMVYRLFVVSVSAGAGVARLSAGL